jgi:DNA-binding transcriptional ArsR family regulator
VDLVRDVWTAVRPDWERYGRGAVDLALGARREALARGTDWHEVARSSCDFGALLDTTVAGLPADGELAVVPAFFAHLGLLFDLPGLVLVGVRADITGVSARARTELLARRLKAISDPTRLAIVEALRGGPHTVTELAAAFALAQPTVSNHVRVLREAGLLSDVRQGTRRNLVVQADAAGDLLADLRGVLVAGAGE